jgi:hypothetical protein
LTNIGGDKLIVAFFEKIPIGAWGLNEASGDAEAWGKKSFLI